MNFESRWFLHCLVISVWMCVAGVANAADPSPLTQAVLVGDIQAARSSLEQGASVNEIDPATGYSPLYAAVSPGGPRDRDMVELLINKGARLDVIDPKTQLTPLAASMIVTERGPFAQLERARAANVVEALLHGGANPNQTLDAGETPLMLAVSMNNLSAMQLLLARGANPNLRDANQSTALHVAYATERPAPMIDALTTAGANPNLRDAQGKLPHELSPQFVPAEAATAPTEPQPPVAPAPEPPKSSMTKWLIGGAVVATAVVGAAVLAHLVKEQNKQTSTSATSANTGGLTLATTSQGSVSVANSQSSSNVNGAETSSHKLTTGVLPENGGRVELNPATIMYARGARVIATAIPAPGYSFYLWQLGCSGAGASCVTTVNKDAAFVALFYRTSDGPPRGIREQGGSICTMNGDRSFTCRDKKTGVCTSGCKPADSRGAGTTVPLPMARPIGAMGNPGSSATTACRIENYRGPNDDPQVDSFCKNAYVNQCIDQVTGTATYRSQTTSVCKVLDGLLRSIGSLTAASYCSYCR